MSTRRATIAERAQGIVEFAVIFPLFIVLLFIMIDGGVLMGRYNQVNHGAQEGARLAAAGATADQVVARVQAQSQQLWSDATENCEVSNGDEICVEWADAPSGQAAGEVGSYVKVTTRYRYNFVTPLTDRMFGMVGLTDRMDVSACAVAKLERPVNNPSPVGTAAC